MSRSACHDALINALWALVFSAVSLPLGAAALFIGIGGGLIGAILSPVTLRTFYPQSSPLSSFERLRLFIFLPIVFTGLIAPMRFFWLAVLPMHLQTRRSIINVVSWDLLPAFATKSAGLAPIDFCLAVTGLTVALLIVMPTALDLFRTFRLLADHPTSKARSPAMGLAEFCGRAWPASADHLAGAPILTLSDVELPGYESKMEPFYLEDETGSILVDPKGAVDWRRISMSAGIPRCVALTRRVERRTVCTAPGTYVFVTIMHLMPGDPVYLIGPVADTVLESRDLSLNERARRLKGDKPRMKALDANADGEVDVEEWDRGLRDTQAREEQKERAVVRLTPGALELGVMSRLLAADRHGGGGRTPEQLFFLSDSDEVSVRGLIFRRMALTAAYAAATAGLCAWGVLHNARALGY